PDTERVMRQFRESNCGKCDYCISKRDPEIALKRWFGYDHFRKFGGEPLQENAVKAALQGQSILAIFPTGGGKSLTFQIPALMAGESVRGLTVVISPLQSLMKDQVENLEKKGIADAVYINGLLSMIERKNALERIVSGEASILYIAPESLRSKTIEKVLMGRTIVRIVIDEAHCFSAWGQDFRIEYMYIADFIRQLQAKKGVDTPIPVSCFTATAKPKVVSDIADYFRNNLGLELKLYTTDAARTNLHYTVLYRNEDEKYQTLRNLLNESDTPAIVYVTRTRTAENIAARLNRDGLQAKAFHGQMDTRVKVQAQDDFINNRVRIIVATSAFGMGVDKSDVGLVVHYEISDSLENYIQEAGRAGRDVNSDADCYVLYNDDDLNRHFILLNQTKLTLSEINQVWRAVKNLTSKRSKITISALEIARKAGWDEIRDVETKVKSAIAALENAGFIKRGMNSPCIFATSIVPRTMDEAVDKI
ncbi:MAG TPA: RecQ family ATP-dependent DNA helicase, partial [Rikenellaceae bacterium]|nr:RecQ family ATP-dependent DNA helicase [Rikenellaceae bacterium]